MHRRWRKASSKLVETKTCLKSSCFFTRWSAREATIYIADQAFLPRGINFCKICSTASRWAENWWFPTVCKSHTADCVIYQASTRFRTITRKVLVFCGPILKREESGPIFRCCAVRLVPFILSLLCFLSLSLWMRCTDQITTQGKDQIRTHGRMVDAQRRPYHRRTVS